MNDKDHFDSVFGVAQNKARTEMRDDIAVRVLIAMIETTPPPSDGRAASGADMIPSIARTAYRFADAMMAARGGREEKPSCIMDGAIPVEINIGIWDFKVGDQVKFTEKAKAGLLHDYGIGVIVRNGVDGAEFVIDWENGYTSKESVSSLRFAEN